MEMLLDHNFKYPEFGAVTAFTVTQVKDEFTKLDFVKNRYDDHVLSFLRQVEEEKTVQQTETLEQIEEVDETKQMEEEDK